MGIIALVFAIKERKLINGKVPVKYDWYRFVQGGAYQIHYVIPIIFFITFLISIILWIVNKKIKK